MSSNWNTQNWRSVYYNTSSYNALHLQYDYRFEGNNRHTFSAVRIDLQFWTARKNNAIKRYNIRRKHTHLLGHCVHQPPQTASEDPRFLGFPLVHYLHALLRLVLQQLFFTLFVWWRVIHCGFWLTTIIVVLTILISVRNVQCWPSRRINSRDIAAIAICSRFVHQVE